MLMYLFLITSSSDDDVTEEEKDTAGFTVINNSATAYVFNSSVLTDSSNPDTLFIIVNSVA